MERVIVIPALQDNFEYVYRFDRNKAIAIDPAEGGPILKEIKKHDLKLKAILVTHHHWDHSAGAAEIQNKTNCKVIKANAGMEDGEVLEFGGCKIRIITTPGHTADSVCYYVEPLRDEEGIIFTGDTLFISGCGTPIECDAKIMWESLEKLASLPDETLVYPGHDYTEHNYTFALTIEPGSKDVQKLLEEIRQKGSKAIVPSTPINRDLHCVSTIGKEKKTNVFLRARTREIKAAINMQGASDAEAFAEIRKRKNKFG